MDYFERKTDDKQEILEIHNTYSLNTYPQELSKKVTLLMHFKSYLQAE